MKVLDKGFGEFPLCVVNDVVDGAEVVGCFDDVIDVNRALCNSDSIGSEYVTRLIMSQSAPFDMV